MSTLKTGMVYQRTLKGPNYLCLGKASVNGKTMVISVKNGNINANGKSRTLSKADGGVVIFAHMPEDIARVHQIRKVDVGSVFTKGAASTAIQTTLKRLLTQGIETAGELPSLAELR